MQILSSDEDNNTQCTAEALTFSECGDGLRKRHVRAPTRAEGNRLRDHVDVLLPHSHGVLMRSYLMRLLVRPASHDGVKIQRADLRIGEKDNGMATNRSNANLDALRPPSTSGTRKMQE